MLFEMPHWNITKDPVHLPNDTLLLIAFENVYPQNRTLLKGDTDASILDGVKIVQKK
jgi:hypothetical protein